MSADRAERTSECGRKDALDFLGRAEKHLDLQRILAKKNDAQYRQSPLSVTDAKKIIEWARRLVSNARSAVDASD